jgi:hypothetical protein
VKEIIELYIAIGAGGLCVVTVVVLLFKVLNSITPNLSELKELTKAHKEVISNNTSAIHEVSKSNDNVAAALALLENSTKQMVHLLTRHDMRAENMEREIISILEITRECKKGK